MTISYAGGPWYVSVRPDTAPTVSPVNVGDLMVAGGWVGGTLGQVFTGLSGGGVTTWNITHGAVGANEDAILAWGIVTSTTPAALTPTFGGSGSTWALGCMEFSGLSTWTVDTSAVVNQGPTTSGNWPSVTASYTDELYFGVMGISSNTSRYPPAAGSPTAGYTYVDASYNDSPGSTAAVLQFCYKLNVGSGSYSPGWSYVGPGGVSNPQLLSFLFNNVGATTQIVMIT